MNAIVLAAGYATRPRPLAEAFPDPLLPVGGRPMIEHLFSQLAVVPDVERVHVVTNARFAPLFARWAADRGPTDPPVELLDDGTTSDEDRLGAVGDLRFAIHAAGLTGIDLLVVAGDNLFDGGLAELAAFFHREAGASCIGVARCDDPELVRKYSGVEIGQDDRVVCFVEKPADPHFGLVGAGAYVLHRDHLPLLDVYLAEGGAPDPPGRFIEWLHRRVPVRAFLFEGAWLDIGDPAQLLAADNLLRARRGLAPRPAYSLAAA